MKTNLVNGACNSASEVEPQTVNPAHARRFKSFPLSEPRPFVFVDLCQEGLNFVEFLRVLFRNPINKWRVRMGSIYPFLKHALKEFLIFEGWFKAHGRSL